MWDEETVRNKSNSTHESFLYIRQMTIDERTAISGEELVEHVEEHERILPWKEEIKDQTDVKLSCSFLNLVINKESISNRLPEFDFL